MPSGYSTCPECGESLVSFKIRAHLLDAHGIDRAPVSKEESRRRHRENAQLSMTPNDPRPTVPDPDNPYPDEPEPEAPPIPEPDVAEAIPRKPGLVQRLRARRNRPSTPEGRTPSGERAPRQKRPSRRRLPLDADISDVWAFAGRRLEPTQHYPTGRMLQYQAPAAGVIIDRAIAGTLPDRVIFQPIARNRDKYEDVAFLLAGPLLTFSITTTMGQMQQAQEDGDEELFNELAGRLTMQREMFAWCLSMMLPRLAAGAKQAAQKKAKRDAVIADAFPELGDQDPVEALVQMLFQPPHFQEAAQNGKPSDGTTAEHGEPHHMAFGE